MEKIKNIFNNKKILVTGGAGSIGSEIVRQLLQYNPAVVRIFDNNENRQFLFEQELEDHKNVRFLIGDIRDLDRMKTAMEGIDIVFHAAALKHVPLCEYNPFEAVMTNTIGTQNVIKAALSRNVDKVVVISTDKATNPINTMGATKLLAEKLTIAINSHTGRNKTKFSCVRFGNVMGSNGSAIHLFKGQIKNKKPVTITEPDMTRFIMSIQQAISLVLKTAEEMNGGEVFILKMPVFNLKDFVDVIIEEVAPKYNINLEDVKIKKIGARPGEKLYESLMTEEEAENALETDKMFIVLPHKLLGLNINKDDYKGTKACALKDYNSKNLRKLSKPELKKLLYEAKLL